jgi:hypothetical protein
MLSMRTRGAPPLDKEREGKERTHGDPLTVGEIQRAVDDEGVVFPH